MALVTLTVHGSSVDLSGHSGAYAVNMSALLSELGCILHVVLYSIDLYVKYLVHMYHTSRVHLMFIVCSICIMIIISASEYFTRPSRSRDQLIVYGNQAMVALFGGKDSDSLMQILRHKTLVKKTYVGSTFVRPERLPTTEDSTLFHSLWTYHLPIVFPIHLAFTKDNREVPSHEASVCRRHSAL